jgi:DNA primase
MNGRIFPHNFVEEVRAASDIVAVISDYVRLKKTGQNFVGLCPFHS